MVPLQACAGWAETINSCLLYTSFLEQWPLKCVNGTLYTLDGPVEDESEIKQRILENIEEYVTSGLSKKVTNILETIKLLAFSDPFPIEQDCICLLYTSRCV